MSLAPVLISENVFSTTNVKMLLMLNVALSQRLKRSKRSFISRNDFSNRFSSSETKLEAPSLRGLFVAIVVNCTGNWHNYYCVRRSLRFVTFCCHFDRASRELERQSKCPKGRSSRISPGYHLGYHALKNSSPVLL